MNKEAFFKVRAITNPHIFNVPLKLDKRGIGWLFCATVLARNHFRDEKASGHFSPLNAEGDIYVREIQGQLTRFATGVYSGKVR